MRATALRARRLNARHNRQPLIPSEILKALAQLNLPKNEFVYQAVLEKLLRVHSHAPRTKILTERGTLSCRSGAQA
jgi:hypothetical protein